MKSIVESINEARKISYRVSLHCFNKDNDHLPVEVDILVDAADQKCFEEFLKKEHGEWFAHAQGGNIELA